jgi:hypothetical protein
MYCRQLRVSKDVRVRQKTSPSTVKQYPSHIGKNPQFVRGPLKLQLRNQKRPARINPSQP